MYFLQIFANFFIESAFFLLIFYVFETTLIRILVKNRKGLMNILLMDRVSLHTHSFALKLIQNLVVKVPLIGSLAKILLLGMPNHGHTGCVHEIGRPIVQVRNPLILLNGDLLGLSQHLGFFLFREGRFLLFC